MGGVEFLRKEVALHQGFDGGEGDAREVGEVAERGEEVGGGVDY